MAEQLRAPFPYFGSKRLIADQVWQALGPVASYCEPFAGSAAVLLARPGGAGRIETINDINGHIANFWRSVRSAPEEVARHLDYPVIEVDLHSRHRWLNARGDSLARDLDDDPDFYDAKAAAWWAWGASAWIGSGWCAGGKASEQVPQLYSGGVHSRRLSEQVPSVGDTGKGVHSRRIVLDDVCDRLAERLRRVRVLCGDWRRAVTHSAMCDRLVGGRVGVFFDPPYLNTADGKARTAGVYGKHDDGDIATEVAVWARRAAEEHPSWRIIIAGYEGEHDMPGWEVVAWDTSAGLWGSGGYGRKAGGQAEENATRERLWMSPACDSPSKRGQVGLFR